VPQRIPRIPEGLHIKPSVEDLTAKLNRDPDALKSVDRFTIGKEGVGKIMFLEDVDLSGIDDLGEVFSFTPGSVSAFPDSKKKPPPGSGCNQPARVVLELDAASIKRLAKKPGKTIDEFIYRIRTRLQRLCAESDSNFVSFELTSSEGGIWTFEVKHWSRWEYKLPRFCYCGV
jgi:hypothetical protein